MKKRNAPPPTRKGLAIVGFFAATAAAGVGAAALLLWPSTPARAAAIARPVDRAKIAYADRDFKKAEALLDGVRGREADLLRGKLKRETGRFTEARELFAQVLKEDEDFVEAVQGLAQVYSALHQDELAIPFWRKLTALSPKDPYAWRELALAQVRAKDSIGAISSLQKSLELDPGQQDLSLLMGEVACGKLDADWPHAGTRPAQTAALRTPTIPDPNRYFPQAPWRNR